MSERGGRASPEAVSARDVELLTYREADRLLGRRRGYAEGLVLAGEVAVLEDERGRHRIPAWALKEWQRRTAVLRTASTVLDGVRR